VRADVNDAVQIAGAAAVLAAFLLVQRRVLSTRSPLYGALNLLGSGVLAVDAFLERQWGFVILQTTWALVAAWGLAVRRR
jgi:hypothetical protein